MNLHVNAFSLINQKEIKHIYKFGLAMVFTFIEANLFFMFTSLAKSEFVELELICMIQFVRL